MPDRFALLMLLIKNGEIKVIPLAEAQKISHGFMVTVIPFCKYREVNGRNVVYCHVAGSVRRKKAFVKDIEIVLVRDTAYLKEFKEAIDKLQKVKGSPLGKYTQRIFRDVKLDVFMCNDDNFGNIFAMRTGSVDFSKYLALRWVSLGYKSKNGYLYNYDIKKRRTYGQKYKFYTEKSFFDFLGLNYIEPEKRI